MFRDLPTYAEMTTNSFWSTRTPAHWAVRPGLAVLQENRRQNIGLIETQVLSLSYGRVVVKPIEKQHGLAPHSYEGYQVLEPGDIVVRPTDLQNDQTSLRVGQVKDRGVITSAYIGLRPTGDWDGTYAYQYLTVVDSTKRIYGMGSGLRQQLGWADVKRMPCLVPPGGEQRAIAKYLDHANARISKTITAKLRLIDLLKEQRGVLIDDLIFGVGAELRDSGIPWLGEVPASWEVASARHTFKAVNRVPVGNEPRLSVTQASGLVRTEDMLERSTQAQDVGRFQRCEPEDMVLNKYKAHLGVFWGASEPGLITPNYTVFRQLRPISTRYFELLFRSRRYLQVFREIVYGVTDGMSPLYLKDFYRLPLLSPPLSEQEAIVRRAQALTAEMQHVIGKLTREISLLQEFRTRLVADVVTGQVDVRAIAASLPDTIEQDTELDLLLDDDLEDVLGGGEG